jgi:CRP/FNR family cyclic AMP-dependent transcriptional regulator
MPVDLFAAVPEGELLAAGQHRRFRRDEVVFHQDDPGDTLHVVRAGRFAARITTDLGDTATLAVFARGQVFGLLAALRREQRRTATVVALEQGETLSLSADGFAQLRAAHPEVSVATESLLVALLAATNDRLVEALYLPAQQRVRRRLLELARLYGDGESEVTVPLSQDYLADLAGTTRETVNRVLKQEVERGTVTLARRKITVHLPVPPNDRAK